MENVVIQINNSDTKYGKIIDDVHKYIDDFNALDKSEFYVGFLDENGELLNAIGYETIKLKYFDFDGDDYRKKYNIKTNEFGSKMITAYILIDSINNCIVMKRKFDYVVHLDNEVKVLNFSMNKESIKISI